jgi:hypothetical protein
MATGNEPYDFICVADGASVRLPALSNAVAALLREVSQDRLRGVVLRYRPTGDTLLIMLRIDKILAMTMARERLLREADRRQLKTLEPDRLTPPDKKRFYDGHLRLYEVVGEAGVDAPQVILALEGKLKPKDDPKKAAPARPVVRPALAPHPPVAPPPVAPPAQTQEDAGDDWAAVVEPFEPGSTPPAPPPEIELPSDEAAPAPSARGVPASRSSARKVPDLSVNLRSVSGGNAVDGKVRHLDAKRLIVLSGYTFEAGERVIVTWKGRGKGGKDVLGMALAGAPEGDCVMLQLQDSGPVFGALVAELARLWR